MLFGLRPARNLLETCSLASLRLVCIRDDVVIVLLRPKSTMLESQKTCSVFTSMNLIDLT